MARLDLSPRDVGRLIDDSFAAYRANLKPLALAALVTVFPVALLYGIVQVFYVRGMLDVFAVAGSGASAMPAGYDETMLVVYALSGVASIAYMIGQVFFRAVVYGSGAALLEGRRLEAKAMLKGGVRIFLPLIGVQLLTGVVVYAAALLTIVPALGFGAVVATVFLAVVGPVVALEPGDPVRALKRSYELVRGNFWRVALLAIAAAVVMFELESAVTSPIVIRDVVLSIQNPGAIFHQLPLYWKVLEGILQALAVVLVLPIADLTWMRCYLDLRARGEGLDLLVRANELAAGVL